MHSDVVEKVATRDQRPTQSPSDASLQPSITQNGIEVYGTPTTTAIASPPPATAAPAKQTDAKPEVKEEELKDAPDAVIEINTRCKRPGCNAVYKDESMKQDECVFHSGAPIFHEGSKVGSFRFHCARS